MDSHFWKTPKLCLNSAIYILMQTFKIFAETGSKLLKILTICLFQNSTESDGLPNYIMITKNQEDQDILKFISIIY